MKMVFPGNCGCKFGIEGMKLQNDVDSSSYWKNAWHNIYSFRRGLKTQAILDEVILDSHNEELHHRKRLGVLTASEEDEAIFYDNPSLGPPEGEMYCLGYFGMLKFNITVPSGGGVIERELVAV